MSLASAAYREVEAIVQTWTSKYQYHISLADSKPNQVKFMVEFSLPQAQQPVPVATVRVYFTCTNQETQKITFRFEKDSLIHSPSKTIRKHEIEKWIDDALSKKLLVRETVFYLGTAYESTRVHSERQDNILRELVKPKEQEFVYIHPDLLADQKRLIQVMQKPPVIKEQVDSQLKKYFREVDKEDIGVITHQELLALIQNIGVKLTALEEKQLLKRADPQETGMVEYKNYVEVARQFFQGLEGKVQAEAKLKSNYDEEVFSSILTLIGDQSQNFEDFIIERLPQKEEDEKKVANISEVKKVLDELNKKIKDEGKGEPLSAVELADITKLITDAHGYKQIPYGQIHRHIIEYKIKQIATGRVNSRVNNLEVHLQEIFSQFDEKKNGRIKLEQLEQALSKSEKIKLTRSQLYLLKSLLVADGKGEISYSDNSKFLAELIKRFYLSSSKKRRE